MKFLIVLAFFLAVLLWCSAFGLGAHGQVTGELLYKKNCLLCHGADGTRGLLGARNLQRSVLGDSAIRRQIMMGKGFMPSFKKKLGEPELKALVDYVKGLRVEH